VIEVMGGTDQAADITFAAISSGKHVVSANKKLVANYLDVLSRPEGLLAQAVAKFGVGFGVEAAVCGGEDYVCS
jgi:homoserine dehydrogenase